MTGVNDTGAEFITSVNKTGNRVMTGVVDKLNTNMYKNVLQNSKWLLPHNQGLGKS